MSRDVWALKVFRRAYALSLDVHRASLGFRKSSNMVALRISCGGPRNRSVRCWPKGRGRQLGSDVEFRRYVIMALGSVEEAKLWCVYARDLGFADAASAGAWQSSYEEVARMLQGLLKHLQKGLEA